MNGIELMLYIYFRFLAFIFVIIPLYMIMKYSKLEKERIKNKAIVQYKDNLKNIMPSVFRQLFITFLLVFIGFGVFLYIVTKSLVFSITVTTVMVLMICFIGFYKFPAYICEDGLYFNQYYTWKGFNGYERIGDTIKLIGKKYITPDIYLKDKNGEIEEILKKYFKY
ncbi:hypothetical protein [Methanotorris formicicus]|uniref:DUF5673 domain-containing protein n=1 Tax=Methanotorris formicicus Mc-S-70 TaxID=647171 RepID=H1KYX7_9EURY|nr:hypothetical protein [Methanotorris formicicus]EHP86712.1 hypothetical protein MetfoDRAFT_1000 [Methanotorris formicicus Mc-S-70]